MSKLTEFLMTNPIDELAEETVIFSLRIKDEKGDPLKATIKPMSAKAYNSYQKQATKIGKKGKVDFDNDLYQSLIVINHTADPNFRDEKNMEALTCQTPEQYLNRVLLPGEISELAKSILDVSGFNDDLEELKEKAKN
jgi:Phage XkdN-like tail assembly chaperone protein, TAC